MTSREELHNSAVKVIDEYENEGKPLVLYLRKFDITVLHGKNAIDRYLTENYIASHLPQGINIITIQDQDDITYDLPGGTAFSRRVPSLLLDDSEWKNVVDELIKRADIIISECLMLSEGVRQELLSCYNYQKFDQTILILPPPKSELATLDDDDLIQMFPRGIWANEFHTSDLFNSFIIIDLLERAIQIAGLSKEERVSLVDGRVRRSKYPVTYKGVVDGYVNSARMSEINDEVFGHVEDEASWHYKFWGYFRALSILSLQLTRRQIKLEDSVYQMCECYLKMGYLMLRGERQGKTIIIRGDVEFARQCATSAYSLASNNQITYYERLAESLFEEINKMESAIEANKDSVIIKSPIKGIMTKKGSVSDLT